MPTYQKRVHATGAPGQTLCCRPFDPATGWDPEGRKVLRTTDPAKVSCKQCAAALASQPRPGVGAVNAQRAAQ